MLELVDLLVYIFNSVKDGKVDEAEIAGFIGKVILIMAKMKNKPITAAQADELAHALVEIYKLYA